MIRFSLCGGGRRAQRHAGLCVTLCALLSCASGAGPPRGLEAEAVDGPAPWTSLSAHAAPVDFKFVVVSDRTGGKRAGVFEKAIGKINLLQPAFVVSVGDLIEGYTEDRAQLDAEWAEFQDFVARLEMPFFYAAGNHDFSNQVMSREWRQRFGPSFYHFRYQGVLFLVLNSELFGSATQSEPPPPDRDTQAEQMAYAEQVLAAHPDARWTFVIVHRPLWDRREVNEDWLRVEGWLGERPYTVFAGHLHRYTAHRRHDRRFITLATTGGASPLRGIDRGEFDHVALVSVGDGEPVIANLMLDGIHDADVRSEETRKRLTRLERAITSEPQIGVGTRFRRSVARFRVANNTGEAIVVTAEPRPGRDLVPGSGPETRSVAPGATEVFEVPIEARTPKPFGELAPATVDWTLRGSKQDGTTLEVEATSWLLPEQDFECPRARRAVRVDGVLDEWEQLPFFVEARPARADAPQDASVRFAVAYDDEFLYVAARATDPSPFASAERTARDQDAITISLDARPSPARDENQPFFRSVFQGTLKQQLIAWLLPGEAREDPIFGMWLPMLPDATRRAARTVDGGYAAEIAIPRAFLDERAGGPWDGFRLNVSLQDYASDGAAHVTHDWRPSRFGLNGVTPVAGSGTFVRVE